MTHTYLVVGYHDNVATRMQMTTKVTAPTPDAAIHWARSQNEHLVVTAVYDDWHYAMSGAIRGNCVWRANRDGGDD